MSASKSVRLVLMNYLCLILLLSTAVLGSPTPPTAENVPASDNVSPIDDILAVNGFTTSATVNVPGSLSALAADNLPASDNESPSDGLTTLETVDAPDSGMDLFLKSLAKPLKKLIWSCLGQLEDDLIETQPLPCLLEQIPEHLLINIITRLSISDRGNFQSTCKTFHGIVLSLKEERQLAEIEEYRYYNKLYDWQAETWVKLLYERRNVDDSDVRLHVQEYFYNLRDGKWRDYAPLAKVKKLYDEHASRQCGNPKHKKTLYDFVEPSKLKGLREVNYSDDQQMDGQIALILSHCEHFTTNKAHAYIQEQRKDPAYREDNKPEFANLVANLKIVQKARREIWKEKLAASDLMGFDDDSRMAVVLEKLLPDVVQPTVKDAIQQARRTLRLMIAVQKGKYHAVRYYVKLGGAIQESSLIQIFHWATTLNSFHFLRGITTQHFQILSILLQHPAVSVDIFSQLLLEAVKEQDPSIVKILLEDQRAVQPAISKAYEYAFTPSYSDIEDLLLEYMLRPESYKEFLESERKRVKECWELLSKRMTSDGQ